MRRAAISLGKNSLPVTSLIGSFGKVTLPAWRTRVFAIVLVLLACTVSLIVWRRSAVPAVQHAACRDCNVLLITIDTLRADRVGAFGGPASLTPVLDRLASEGLRLTRAYTVAPLTLPAHTSILTAVSPPIHGVRTNGLEFLTTLVRKTEASLSQLGSAP